MFLTGVRICLCMLFAHDSDDPGWPNRWVMKAVPGNWCFVPPVIYSSRSWCRSSGRLQLKCDVTRWCRVGKWRGNWRMECVASTLHTTSEHGVSRITTADAHTSAASSRLNWRLRLFKWTRPFRRKTKSGFCACAITFQLACTILHCYLS